MIGGIRIGPFDYSFEEKEHVYLDGREVLGCHLGDRLKIEVKQGQPPLLRLQTIWHEILHAFDRDGHYKWGEDDVNQLADSILMLLRDNPWLGQVTGLPERTE